MLSTNKQTDKLTNATKNITSFVKEVKKNTDSWRIQLGMVVLMKVIDM